MTERYVDAIHAAVPPGSIVAGYDGSEHASRALEWAAREAALANRILAVVHGYHPVARTLLGALEMEGGNRFELLHHLRISARVDLEEAAARTRKARPGLEVWTTLTEADPRDALVGASERAHLVVVGSRGRGPVASLLLGSVSTAVSQLAHCPLVVCRPRPADGPHRGVVVGADGSPESAPVIEFAFRQASLHGVPLTVMHCVWEVVATDAASGPAARPTDVELLLAESVAGFSAVYPDVSVELAPARGLVDLVLADAAPAADRLVVGRRHMSRVSRQLHSSMAAAVLERAAGTVAVVPEGAAS